MTPLPRGVTVRRFIEALSDDGFALNRSRGSHRVYTHPDGRIVIVAFHRGGAGFPIGTLKRMVRDAGWMEADLQRLGLSS